MLFDSCLSNSTLCTPRTILVRAQISVQPHSEHLLVGSVCGFYEQLFLLVLGQSRSVFALAFGVEQDIGGGVLNNFVLDCGIKNEV